MEKRHRPSGNLGTHDLVPVKRCHPLLTLIVFLYMQPPLFSMPAVRFGTGWAIAHRKYARSTAHPMSAIRLTFAGLRTHLEQFFL